ncbi:hypothetical protein RHGRI_009307 [Rhododendron griersonianum]|uniref:Uncharacterized protein n=1 Tax=Rhododendron griersonianum TaxID=479676 RepID=A0AAV6L736_9ERIC|nr:hypothetical protein RHGRI_009307 [Rhododendron griersonianum]
MASLTLTGLLKQVASQFPSRRAIQFDLTHTRLQELIDQAGSQLVPSGDMVALTFPTPSRFLNPSPSWSSSIFVLFSILASLIPFFLAFL